MKSDSVIKQCGNKDKISQYKWTMSDSKGDMRWIHKERLEVDKTYQRDHSSAKVVALASEWSWVACGAIIVGRRDTGDFVIIDGQHRVLAALRRSDISELPCIVFGISTIKNEAEGFVRSNTHRKHMSVFDTHKAKVIANDIVALDIQRILDELCIVATPNGNVYGTIKCIGLCYDLYKNDTPSFVKALRVSRSLSESKIIYEQMLGGLWYIEHAGIDISENTAFYKRLSGIPTSIVNKSISEARSYYIKGGNKVFAIGILNAVNKGLRNKYAFVSP